MLSRFAELHQACAQSSGKKGKDDEAEEEEAVAKWTPPPTEEMTEEELDEYLEFLDHMHELYTEMLADEGAAASACIEVRHSVENMEETIQQEKDALLPGLLAALSNRFESQELVCQRMINRAKGMTEVLKTRGADYEGQDLVQVQEGMFSRFFGKQERMCNKVPEYLEPVRQSIAKVRKDDYKELVLRFFTARSSNKAEVLRRTDRQLRFAFPEASDNELEFIMQYPENALHAIRLRLEKGVQINLEEYQEELEADPEKENQKKLEQGAKELKLMMLQFSELIDNQGEELNAIEANIKTVLEETHEAIGILADAVEEKKKSEANSNRLKCALRCGGCCLLLIVLWVMSSWYARIKGVGKGFGLLVQLDTVAVPDTWHNHTRHRRHGLEHHHLNVVEKHHEHVAFALEKKHTEKTPRRRPGFLDNQLVRSVAVMARGTATKTPALRKRKAMTRQNETIK